MLNPVFRKDMHIFFRNIKTYIGLVAYLIIMTLITRFVIKLISVDTYNGFNPEYVIGAFLGVMGFQMVAITFIVPAFTSNSISGERERQTLDFMLITRMTTWDIVVGKLMSSLMLVCLMIVASMPVYAVIFYYGGVSIITFLLNNVFLLIYAAFVGSVSVLFSTIFKRTVAAAAITNLFILGISIGTFILVGIIVGIAQLFLGVSSLTDSFVGIICVAVLSLNPAIAFVSIMDTHLGTDYIWSALGMMVDADIDLGIIQEWHIIAVVYALVAYGLLKVAARNIAPIKRVKHSYGEPKQTKSKEQGEQ